MKRAWFTLLVVAAIGCRAPAPSFNPFLPQGPQRVPPPSTGSIGTPMVQPANPYYPNVQGNNLQGNGGAAAPQPRAGATWRPPGTSTNLAAGPTGGSQPPATTSVANSNAAGSAGSNIAPPNVNNFNAGTGTPQVTNPAVIRNQATPVGSGTRSGQSVFGAPGQSAANNPNPTNPLITNPNAAGSPQLLRTNSGPAAGGTPSGPVSSTIRGTLGINVNGDNSTNPATGGSGFGQPIQPNQPNVQPGVQPNVQPGGGWPVPTAPSGTPLNGMPVNDATSAYPAAPATPPWSLGGLRNWLQSQPWLQARTAPAMGMPAGTPYAAAPAYARANVGTVAPPATTYPSAVASTTPGYSSAAPAAGLPLRGMQGTATAAPAAPINTNVTNPAGGVVTAGVGVPSATPRTTVRGNDDEVAQPAAFVSARGQSSAVPHTAERYGHHPEYQWLRGKLEYSATERRWKLRYIPHDAPEGRIDGFGGSVVLAESDLLEGYESGEMVSVTGRLGETTVASDYAPIYRAERISRLD